MAGEHILIVDDEPSIQSSLRGVLEDEGYRVTAVGTGDDAVALLPDENPDLVFLDIWMPGRDGLETLAEMKRLRPGATVVMISGHGTIETAVKATRLGAYDFIEKPLSLEKTLLTVTRALDHARLEQENQTLKERLGERSEIIGESAVMRALREQIATAAPTNGRGRRDLLAQGAHHRALADDLRALAQPLLERLVLLLETRVIERPRHGQQGLLERQRLLDEVVGAEPGRLDRRLDGAVAGDHHDRGAGPQALHLGQRLEAVAAGHPDVEEDEVGSLVGQEGDGVVPGP